MGEEIACENGQIADFEGLVTLTLDPDHIAYRHASLVDLHPHTKCHRNRRNFFVDGRTDGRTFETHFIYTLYLKGKGQILL